MTERKDFLSRFGFHSVPFTCEIRVKERFVHEIFDQPLVYLQRVVEKRLSGALIAPAGTGKSALLRALVARLPEARYQIHYVKVTDLSKRDLCREIAAALGTDPAGSYPTLVRRLQEHLACAFDSDGLRSVLIFDEAHEIRPQVLGILRLLTNFAMDSRLVVSVILAGQPPLANLLRQERLADVAKRLAHCASLRLLSRPETGQYVQHRARIAGTSTCPFDTAALEALYEIARGNLRATDHLALKTLEVAHDADCDVATSTHVVEARGLLWA